MEQDKKLIELFEDFCKKNDEEVKNKVEFMPMCITISKDYSINITAFVFNSQNDKIKMREMLKQFIAVQNIKGYILIQDAKVTKVNQKTGERQVSDVAMRQLFTPKFAINRMQEYCDGVLGKMIEMTDRKDMRNEWDIWNKVEHDEKSDEYIKEYSKYKSEHPELYKGVYELDDYTKAQNDDGELMFAFKISNGEFRYYYPDNVSEEKQEKINKILQTTKEANELMKNLDDGHYIKTSRFKMIRVDKDGVMKNEN